MTTTSSGTRSPSSVNSNTSSNKQRIQTEILWNNSSNDTNREVLLRSRPRAETMPTNSNTPLSVNNLFNSGILYDQRWLPQQQHDNDYLLLSPTTPTTDQLLKGDDNNTIASTFASLGLHDHEDNSYNRLRPRASSSTDHENHVFQQKSIWNQKPFLRNSNSSADLLEMIARQRKVIDNNDMLDANINSTSNQMPSKSLWIGQLDLNVYGSNELSQIFSKFGVIESIRILPDKECAFINFSSVEECILAKETLVNQMSSRLSNHHSVKVGFGNNSSGSPCLTPTSVTPNCLLNSNEVVVGPTRALWVGNLPTNTSQQALANIFSSFGMIESIRVLNNKNCGFINFYTQEEAIRAKRSLQNKEIMGPGTGIIRIGFAKVPSAMDNGLPAMENNSLMDQQHMMMYMIEVMGNNTALNERKLIIQEFGQDESDGPTFDVLHLPSNYYHSIPAAPELGQSRKVDISRLRDIRKRLDTGHITTKELEIIAVECVDELVELCSDYIGNTVIQRLFERCSEMTKSIMLEAVAPFLASIGVHKNGTWAAQKIIDTAKLPSQISIVCAHIQPYVPFLLLDQFGNYVVQCCLSLGPIRNQFIFDAIVDSCWEIAQGRFGARAVRATLESPHVTKRQQKYVAASLVQHALLLATNANGALLLIWLLDTSGIPGRYRVLAPRLLPHLNKLCTHKLANLTVLKLINQRQEPDARQLIIQHLFFSPATNTIEDILHDQVHGVSLVQKILSSSYIELRSRQTIAERVKQLLIKLKLQHVQGYKRLMEEINMVMVDSAPNLVSNTNNSFAMMSPSLAAALHAKYMTDEGVVDEEQAAIMMANFYAAASAAQQQQFNLEEN